MAYIDKQGNVRSSNSNSYMHLVFPRVPRAMTYYNQDQKTADYVNNAVAHSFINPKYLSNTTNSLAYNSMADVLFNHEAQKRRWAGTVLEPTAIEKIPGLNVFNPKKLVRTAIDTYRLFKDTTINPIVGSIQMANEDPNDELTPWGGFKKGIATAGLNTLTNFGNTMDVVSNPVKGAVIEGLIRPDGEGFVKGFQRGLYGDERGRKQYDYDEYMPEHKFLAFALELVSDPLDWISLGAKGGIKAGIKTVLNSVDDVADTVVTTLSKGLTKELIDTPVVKEISNEAIELTTKAAAKAANVADDQIDNVAKNFSKDIINKTFNNPDKTYIIKQIPKYTLGDGEDAVKVISQQITQRTGKTVSDDTIKELLDSVLTSDGLLNKELLDTLPDTMHKSVRTAMRDFAYNPDKAYKALGTVLPEHKIRKALSIPTIDRLPDSIGEALTNTLTHNRSLRRAAGLLNDDTNVKPAYQKFIGEALNNLKLSELPLYELSTKVYGASEAIQKTLRDIGLKSSGLYYVGKYGFKPIKHIVGTLNNLRLSDVPVNTSDALNGIYNSFKQDFDTLGTVDIINVEGKKIDTLNFTDGTSDTLTQLSRAIEQDFKPTPDLDSLTVYDLQTKFTEALNRLNKIISESEALQKRGLHSLTDVISFLKTIDSDNAFLKHYIEHLEKTYRLYTSEVTEDKLQTFKRSIVQRYMLRDYTGQNKSITNSKAFSKVKHTQQPQLILEELPNKTKQDIILAADEIASTGFDTVEEIQEYVSRHYTPYAGISDLDGLNALENIKDLYENFIESVKVYKRLNKDSSLAERLKIAYDLFVDYTRLQEQLERTFRYKPVENSTSYINGIGESFYNLYRPDKQGNSIVLRQTPVLDMLAIELLPQAKHNNKKLYQLMQNKIQQIQQRLDALPPGLTAKDIFDDDEANPWSWVPEAREAIKEWGAANNNINSPLHWKRYPIENLKIKNKQIIYNDLINTQSLIDFLPDSVKTTEEAGAKVIDFASLKQTLINGEHTVNINDIYEHKLVSYTLGTWKRGTTHEIISFFDPLLNDWEASDSSLRNFLENYLRISDNKTELQLLDPRYYDPETMGDAQQLSRSSGIPLIEAIEKVSNEPAHIQSLTTDGTDIINIRNVFNRLSAYRSFNNDCASALIDLDDLHYIGFMDSLFSDGVCKGYALDNAHISNTLSKAWDAAEQRADAIMGTPKFSQTYYIKNLIEKYPDNNIAQTIANRIEHAHDAEADVDNWIDAFIKLSPDNSSALKEMSKNDSIPIYVFDIETTGLNNNNSEFFQIAIKRILADGTVINNPIENKFIRVKVNELPDATILNTFFKAADPSEIKALGADVTAAEWFKAMYIKCDHPFYTDGLHPNYTKPISMSQALTIINDDCIQPYLSKGVAPILAGQNIATFDINYLTNKAYDNVPFKVYLSKVLKEKNYFDTYIRLLQSTEAVSWRIPTELRSVYTAKVLSLLQKYPILTSNKVSRDLFNNDDLHNLDKLLESFQAMPSLDDIGFTSSSLEESFDNIENLLDSRVRAIDLDDEDYVKALQGLISFDAVLSGQEIKQLLPEDFLNKFNRNPKRVALIKTLKRYSSKDLNSTRLIQEYVKNIETLIQIYRTTNLQDSDLQGLKNNIAKYYQLIKQTCDSSGAFKKRFNYDIPKNFIDKQYRNITPGSSTDVSNKIFIDRLTTDLIEVNKSTVRYTANINKAVQDYQDLFMDTLINFKKSISKDTLLYKKHYKNFLNINDSLINALDSVVDLWNSVPKTRSSYDLTFSKGDYGLKELKDLALKKIITDAEVPNVMQMLLKGTNIRDLILLNPHTYTAYEAFDVFNKPLLSNKFDEQHFSAEIMNRLTTEARSIKHIKHGLFKNFVDYYSDIADTVFNQLTELPFELSLYDIKILDNVESSTNKIAALIYFSEALQENIKLSCKMHDVSEHSIQIQTLLDNLEVFKNRDAMYRRFERRQDLIKTQRALDKATELNTLSRMDDDGNYIPIYTSSIGSLSDIQDCLQNSNETAEDTIKRLLQFNQDQHLFSALSQARASQLRETITFTDDVNKFMQQFTDEERVGLYNEIKKVDKIYADYSLNNFLHRSNAVQEFIKEGRYTGGRKVLFSQDKLDLSEFENAGIKVFEKYDQTKGNNMGYFYYLNIPINQYQDVITLNVPMSDDLIKSFEDLGATLEHTVSNADGTSVHKYYLNGAVDLPDNYLSTKVLDTPDIDPRIKQFVQTVRAQQSAYIKNIGYSNGDVLTKELIAQVDLNTPYVNASIDVDTLYSLGFFDDLKANNLVIGTQEVQSKFNQVACADFIKRNAYNQIYYINKKEQATTLYLNMLLNNENGIDTADWFKNLSDSDLYHTLKNNKDVSLVVIRPSKYFSQTSSGVVVEKLAIVNEHSIALARKLNAHIIPTSSMRSIMQTVNDFKIPPILRVVQNISALFKVGYLSSIGWLARNFIDSNYKNHLDMNSALDLPEQVSGLFSTMQLVQRYNKTIHALGRNVSNSTEYTVLYHMLMDSPEVLQKFLNSSDRLKVYYDKFNKTLFTPENSYKLSILKNNIIDPKLFELTDLFIKNGPSAGMVKAVQNNVVTQKGLTSKLLSHWTEKSPLALVFNANEFIEQSARLQSYLYSIQHGASLDEAVERVIKTHFDYSDKTLGMLYTELFFPFMSFSFKNLEYWLETFYANGRVAAELEDILRSVLDFQSLFNPDYEVYKAYNYQFDYEKDIKGFGPNQPWQMINAARLYHVLNGNVSIETGKVADLWDPYANDGEGAYVDADLLRVFKLSPSVLDAVDMLTQPLSQFEQRLLPPYKVLLSTFTEALNGEADIDKELAINSMLNSLPFVSATLQRAGIELTTQGAALKNNNILKRMEDDNPIYQSIASLFTAAYVKHKKYNTWYGDNNEYLSKLPPFKYNHYYNFYIPFNYIAKRKYHLQQDFTSEYKYAKATHDHRISDIYRRTRTHELRTTYYNSLTYNSLTQNLLKKRILDKYYYYK